MSTVCCASWAFRLLVLVPFAAALAGCSPRIATPPPVPTTTEVAVAEDTPTPDLEPQPNEIVLTEPKATLVDRTLVQFEVKYRFSQGRPDKYYSCEVVFPGTKNRARKMMDSWELKKEGVIKDGIRLAEPAAKTFEMHITEATSPRETYRKISNVVSGNLQ